MASEAPSPVKSASRALDVIEHVARAEVAPTFSELSQQLVIPKSSLFHLLNTLVQRGYLEPSDQRGGGYRLGLQIDLIARSVWRTRSCAERAIPILRQLTETLDETSGYFELRDGMAECLATESSRQNLLYRMRIGERVQPYANAGGKAMLASMDEAELEQYLGNVTFHQYTDRTIRTSESLRAELAMIRSRGISVSRGEYLPGVFAVAVPVHADGRSVGAITVAIPESRCSDEIAEHLERALLAVAQQFDDKPRR